MADEAMAKVRSIMIGERIQARLDETVRKSIALEVEGMELKYEPLHDRMISREAWDYVRQAELAPWQVFAHEDLLCALPVSSMYYRGISLLSKKEVAKLATSVDAWEDPDKTPNVTLEKASKVARVYNCIISALIDQGTGWTIENGYRNIIATMSIGLDGTMRNLIGQVAEDKIQALIEDFLRTRGWLSGEQDEHGWQELPNGYWMKFGSEPDVEFQKRDEAKTETVATIEIKGGRDPAGALERLGAMAKSFGETPAKCANFLIAGITTPEMESRLEDMNVKIFLLDDLDEPRKRAKFLNELFHHVVRIAPRTITEKSLKRR